MKLGHARACLTPQAPFYLIGYRSENRMHPAQGVHDDIYANALLFRDDAGEELLIFSADFLEFEEEMAEEVKTLLQDRYGIRRDNVLLCATHDHSSVVGYHRGWYTGKFDQSYYDFLVQTICTALETCRANAQPVTAKLGRRTILGYYGDRNHPGRPADNEVLVVKFFNADGQAVAGFVNWAVHSTVLSGENTLLTGDWAGQVSQKLAAAFGFAPAMLVGAAGDCSNRHQRQGQDFAELERVSAAMAAEIAAIPTEQPLPLGPIRCQTVYHTIHHHMECAHAELRAEIEKYTAQRRTETDPAQVAYCDTRIREFSAQLHTTHYHLDAKAQVFQLGQLQFFVFPGELSSRFGLALKQASPVTGVVCGYTNGYYGYFMPAEEYGLSFETIGSPIPRGEPERLVEKLMQAARRLNAALE